jgi:hypothetical protein
MKYDEAEQQWQNWNDFSLTGIMVWNDQHAIPAAIATTGMDDESAEDENFEDVRMPSTSAQDSPSVERETSEAQDDEETVVDTEERAEMVTATDTQPQAVLDEVIPVERSTIAEGQEDNSSPPLIPKPL